MTRYAHVTDGAIDKGPGTLPTSWRNISGLPHSTDEDLLALGWLPVETTKPDIDPAIETLEGPVLEIQADRVTETFTSRALTQAELNDRIPDLTAEELYDMLAAKAVVTDADRPRPKIVRGA